jgi:hypothetical protein
MSELERPYFSTAEIYLLTHESSARFVPSDWVQHGEVLKKEMGLKSSRGKEDDEIQNS